MRSLAGQLSQAAIACLVLLSLASCTSIESTRYPFFLAPGHGGDSKGSKALLLSLNFAEAVPESLTSKVATVADEVEQYLVQSALDVNRKDFAESRAAWRTAVVEAGGLTNSRGELDDAAVERATSLLVRRLSEHEDFDLPRKQPLRRIDCPGRI